jgi:NADH-quinone oxidoreductase subunit C
MAPPGSIAWRVPELGQVPSADSRGDEVYFPTRERYIEVATALRREGFVTCSDLCAVDYLTQPDRELPAGVPPERFEIVVNLLSHAEARRVRLRVMVPEADPVCPTLFFVYPGTENMEREAYDLFGIRFSGHPDPSRILMPQDWEGHPLRRDYGVGRVPVQFKGAPGPR